MADVNIEIQIDEVMQNVAITTTSAATVSIEPVVNDMNVEIAAGPFTSPSPVYETVIAAETINGGAVIVFDETGKVKLFDISDQTNYGKACGIAVQAAIAGDSLQICTKGMLTQVGSGWEAGELYYIGSNALPSTDFPTAGIVKIIGTGIGTDKIFVYPNTDIITI